jgi:membrane-associated phospholipid phosphatase
MPRASQLADSARSAEPPVRVPRRLLFRRLGFTPLWVVVLALVVFALTTADVRNGGAFTRFDRDVSRWVLDLDLRNSVWPKRFIYLLTLPGQRGAVLVLTIPTIAYLSWRARTVTPLVRYGLALIAMTIVVYVVKDWVARSAPVYDPSRPGEPTSYPSGHVANALLVWGVVWWSARELDPQAVLTQVLNVIRLAGPFTVIIGMTLLDYHWISDFVGGACIAVVLLGLVTLPVWASVCEPVDRRLRRRPATTSV